MDHFANPSVENVVKTTTGATKVLVPVIQKIVLLTGTTAALMSTIRGTTKSVNTDVVRKEKVTTGVMRRMAAGITALPLLSSALMSVSTLN